MNSFRLTAVGNLARSPDCVDKGDTPYTRFCLVGNDYAGRDEALAAIDAIAADYAGHSRAARELAGDCFAAERVIAQLLAEVGL